MKGQRKNAQMLLEGFTLADMEDEAIAYLQEHEPAEGYEVGFSGGKDSIVTLDIVRRAGVKHRAVFCMSYIDPPEVLKFIRKHYPYVEWRRPTKNIYEEIVKQGLPSWKHRWCCKVIKESGTAKNVVTGVRAEESRQRAARTRTDVWEKRKRWMYKPIFHWQEWAVWEYIEKYSLPYPTLYDEGEGRIGCIVCPLSFGTSEAQHKRIERSKARWPGVWRAYKKAAEKYYQRYSQGKDVYYPTFESLWQAFLEGFRR